MASNFTSDLSPELIQRASRIRLLLMDVDGVLTDGVLYYFTAPDGSTMETKGFNTQDGIALKWLTWYGIETGVISGRISPATTERSKHVAMTYVYQGHIEKVPIFEEILAKSGLAPEEIAFVGDDLTDVVLFRRAGLAFAPSNARAEVKGAAHYVTAASGGHGAIREVAELLLKSQGRWADILKKYEVAG